MGRRRQASPPVLLGSTEEGKFKHAGIILHIAVNVGEQILNLQGLSKVGIQCLCEFRATGGSNSPYATGSVAIHM